MLLNPEPTFEAIESTGGRVTKHAEAHVLASFFFVSGEIERVTSYEAGFVGHHTARDGHTVPNPLILDERFLAARVRGRGVSVLSSCSHAGVVNAALGALGAFGGEPIDVILGGYHLAGEGMEPRIEPTVHDLANRVRPRVVAPGHCTGWRAKAALAHTFAPGNYGRASSARSTLCADVSGTTSTGATTGLTPVGPGIHSVVSRQTDN